MLTVIDWSQRSPDDHAFMVGFTLAKRQDACQQIAFAVTILSSGDEIAQTKVLIFMQADAALISLGSMDISNLKNPAFYDEMAPYIPAKPNREIVRIYAQQRQSSGHTSFDQDAESLVQAMIAKFIS